MPSPALSERWLITLIAAIQFINIVDFMMVAPLGPDLAIGLGIATSQMGVVTGVYAVGATISSLLAATWLDRFPRRSAMVFCLLGLAAGTTAAAFAVDTWSLLTARTIAGAFGGPAMALAMAILIDAVPPERRGRAMGQVAGAFSLASVLGVPVGLELARLGSWHTPFWVIGLMTLLLAIIAAWLLPQQTPQHENPQPSWPMLYQAGAPRLGLLMLAVSVTSGFLLIPHLSTFFQINLNYPREDIGLLYLVGGTLSFFSMRFAGRCSDRFGPTKVSYAVTAGYLLVLWVTFIHTQHWLPIMVMFISFMLMRTSLSVAVNTQLSWVAPPEQRAAFMSLKTAVQNAATATGGIISTWILTEDEHGVLQNLATLAVVAAVLAILQPLLMRRLQQQITHKQ
ncbi:MFS transporter [Bacterioplanes sanyensis]|uniref:MFS transporter n=1 Tax=Bacterioplanes sanyensis TaxID=1249553 RepID=A0A222FJR4_9GAMM|nr:MFS transporter [Bacterioplanes sanyensis]ASP38826.1 MFS transporter [Bacterioplanes sanyensis]